MASFKDDYGRFYCKYCDVTVKKNPAAMNQHLLGNRHKRNVALFLKRMRIQNKQEAYAERETQKELRRIQAMTGIQMPAQPTQNSAPPSETFYKQPPPGKVRIQQGQEEEGEEGEDSIEEKINEAINEAVMRINEINVDDYCEAAEAYYLKMNNNSMEGLEDFIKAARGYIINDISAKSVESGEAAPTIGEWTTVEIDEPNIFGIQKPKSVKMEKEEEKEKDDLNEMDEADAIFGTVGESGTAPPRRPVGYRSMYDDVDDENKSGSSGVTVKKEDDDEGNIDGLFKKRRRKVKK